MAKIRLFHIMKTELHHLFHGVTIAHLDLRNRLLTAFSLTIIIDAILTRTLYYFEKGKQGSDINTVWDAFYFSSSQLTTLGKSLSNPVIQAGALFVLIANIYAATVASTVAGMIGAYFYHRTST